MKQKKIRKELTCHCSNCCESSTFCWIVSNSCELTCINSILTFANSISTVFFLAIVSSRTFQARLTISSCEPSTDNALRSSRSTRSVSLKAFNSVAWRVVAVVNSSTSLSNFVTLSRRRMFSRRWRSRSFRSTLNSWQVTHCYCKEKKKFVFFD